MPSPKYCISAQGSGNNCSKKTDLKLSSIYLAKYRTTVIYFAISVQKATSRIFAQQNQLDYPQNGFRKSITNQFKKKQRDQPTRIQLKIFRNMTYCLANLGEKRKKQRNGLNNQKPSPGDRRYQNLNEQCMKWKKYIHRPIPIGPAKPKGKQSLDGLFSVQQASNTRQCEMDNQPSPVGHYLH